MENQYIVIMAGGSGTRLWPLSRKKMPKQFQSFLSSKTLLQETYDRALLVVPKENIYISSTLAYRELILEQLPEMSAEHLILEPATRNTAPAITLVAATLHQINPKAIIATIASDHAIENNDEFVLTLETAFETATLYPDKLTTIGINPTKPDTGLGYIKIGEESPFEGKKRAFFIDDFKEKPDYETAMRYTNEWGYLWNAGYFIFQSNTLLFWTKKYSPETSLAIEKTLTAKNTAEAETLYQEAPGEPIEPLIIEHLSPQERLVIPSSLHWSDVGNWGTLLQFLIEKNHTSIIGDGPHLDLLSENLLVKNTASDKKIVTLGLKNTVIINTPDAILIADQNLTSTEMKKLIEKLKESDQNLL